MSKLIKKNMSLYFALLFLFTSISMFAISQASANSMLEDDCKHCGSISACEDGGQSYGYNECEIDYENWGTPDGCTVSGGACGSDVGEG